MAKFIKLTNAEYGAAFAAKNKTIRLNVDHIIFYHEHSVMGVTHTKIYLEDFSMTVWESPEELEKQL